MLGLPRQRASVLRRAPQPPSPPEGVSLRGCRANRAAELPAARADSPGRAPYPSAGPTALQPAAAIPGTACLQEQPATPPHSKTPLSESSVAKVLPFGDKAM